ncbi:MAG TPA: hypothetical protein PL105_26095, partial [Caldilineaceae bacterium]|nr:hypothetical protein [Caldilineaceae bacterium]
MYDQPSGQPSGQPLGFDAPIRPEFYISLTAPTVNKVMIGLNLLAFAATFVFGLVVFNTWS